jgi:serine/threonine protein phosphatase 1
MERIFAVGDVHGCRSQLEDLLGGLDLRPETDSVVFIGDYIDRGPDSRGVVEAVLDLRRRVPGVICLIGNHERLFLDFLEDPGAAAMFLGNGGSATLRSYALRAEDRPGIDALPEEHRRFFESLVLRYETERYLFVHAGLRPGVPLSDQDPWDLLWIRGEFIRSTASFGKVVVFGHTPFPEPYVDGVKIGIDTGAVYGGRLTCVELPAMRFHTA